MNTSSVISLPVAVDLSADANNHIAVKLTATGVNVIAATTDRVLGTLLRANAKPENGVALGMACDVFLTVGNGIHFVRIGNNTAIAMGDELELSGSTFGSYVKRTAGIAVGIATEAVPANSLGGISRAILFHADSIGASTFDALTAPKPDPGLPIGEPDNTLPEAPVTKSKKG